jgi:DNA-binding SARP family transcriptional activator
MGGVPVALKLFIMNNRVCLLCLFFCLLACSNVCSQSFGLSFSGYEVYPEKRTSLDLGPGENYCFSGNFELSFDFKFRPGLTNYFGYIVRVIANDQQNFDLVYTDLPDTAKNHRQFKLVVGDSYSRIVFEIRHPGLFTQWNKMRLKFDFDHSRLLLFSGKEVFSQPLRLPRDGCYKFLFGINNYHPFETTDVPSMIVRDIRLIEKGKLKHRWPLAEYEGLRPRDDIGGKYAEVKNPLWVKQLHRRWQLKRSFTVNGSANAAFDPAQENLYVISDNYVLEDSLVKNTVSSYRYTENQSIVRGSQSLFIPELHQLVNPDIDSGKMIAFDFKRKRWSDQLKRPLRFTEHYWHYNKFYSGADTSLYLVGGYGHLKYKNSLLRYHFPSKTWHQVKTIHSALTPRYLSALGVVKNGAYVLGGYGNVTGEQALGPRYFYDLLYFDAKTGAIKKIYEFNPPVKDYVFANSMIVDEPTRTFYALTFDKGEYKTSLRLIKGSLDKPGYQQVGSEIPYFFHDVHSFADLYYCKKAGTFVAVTTQHDQKTDKSIVHVYELSSPPVPFVQEASQSKGQVFLYTINAVLLAGLVYLIGIGVQKYRASPGGAPKKKSTGLLSDKAGLPATCNRVFLFGDLQVFDNTGQELTRSFTPLIKELFLIITLYSIRWGRGIKAEKLAEYLWPGKSGENARNNRSTNIARLKAILKNLDSCRLSNETGCWKIELDDRMVAVDYISYLEIVKNQEQLDKQKIIQLTDIIKRGSFLADVEFEWLDTFKSEITNEIINVYLHYAGSVVIADDPEFMIQVANYIVDLDPVNEEAMTIKCKALSHLGKHSLAKNTYEKFVKAYKMIYDENFKKDFHAIFE